MRKKNFLVTVFVISFFFIHLVSADSNPVMPHGFEGYVIDETGEFVPDGTIISAKMKNVFYNTTVQNGAYGSLSGGTQFLITGDGDDIGRNITFYINGTFTGQIVAFQSGMINIGYARFFNISLDSTPLVISSVQTTNIATNQATITWTTSKPANSTVKYGETPVSLHYKKEQATCNKNHSVTLLNLPSSTTFYYEVISYDYSGNILVDSNGGSYYQFTTQPSSEIPVGPSPPLSGGDGEESENVAPVSNPGGPYFGMIDETVQFDGSSSFDSDGYITDYAWIFGDGATITTQTVRTTHVYDHLGNFSVYLIVTDNNDSTNTSKTYVLISSFDSDQDNWSDEAERKYGTDPYNISDYPDDSDNDGIPDSSDADDDNDDLPDDLELALGTNPKNPSDSIRVLNHYGLFLLLDTNADTVVDTYYNMTTGLLTNLSSQGDGEFLIDVDNDGIYDFVFNSASLNITRFSLQNPQEIDIPYILIILVIVFLVLIVIILLYMKRKKGGI